MRTILRQKYEYLVTYLETRLADCEIETRSGPGRTQYVSFRLYPPEMKELRKQIAEIRKIQNSLPIEEFTADDLEGKKISL